VQIEPIPQYYLSLAVYHAPSFGHKVDLWETIVARDYTREVGDWSWKGLGVPATLLRDMQARLSAVLAEHLTFRYGVADELPIRWAGDPEPF
jgi:hypothetical protein